jgi:hypothetical protein
MADSGDTAAAEASPTASRQEPAVFRSVRDTRRRSHASRMAAARDYEEPGAVQAQGTGRCDSYIYAGLAR